jgi:leucyl-tRNA synthetase
LKIDSHKNKDKLEEAKKEVYQKGFYHGVLIVGPFAGQKVQDAKNLVRQQLIDQNLAMKYFEPEKEVISR